MPTFLLRHQHEPRECAIAFAAWRGVDSPLRHHDALCSCPTGGHELWWQIEAGDAEEALARLPEWVRARTSVTQVQEVPVP
jgi:hypothetical protein